MLDKKLSEIEFTALDLETTGLTPSESEIIEIAAIRFNQEGILHTFNFLIKPNKPLQLNSEALKVNGITPKMLENAHNFDKVLPLFEDFIKDSCLVIQNAEFDLGFLMHEFQKRRLQFPTLPVFCTLHLARKLFPEYKKFGLTHLRNYFSIEKMNKSTERHNFHEALDDSYAAMKVLIHAIDNKLNWNNKLVDSIHHAKGYKLTSDFQTERYLF